MLELDSKHQRARDRCYSSHASGASSHEVVLALTNFDGGPMKTSTLLRALAALVFFAIATPVGAQDYQCQDAGGCVATIYYDGASHKVLFRKGDLINTAAGWIVDPQDGWKPVPSGGGGLNVSLPSD